MEQNVLLSYLAALTSYGECAILSRCTQLLVPLAALGLARIWPKNSPPQMRRGGASSAGVVLTRDGANREQD
jgi:hypothetical protein